VGALVDRLSILATGQALPTQARDAVIKAVGYWTEQTSSKDWRINRVKTAAYLIFTSPNYQVQR
jgi:hypothetical protein